MNESPREVGDYVRAVLRRIPRAAAERGRIADDVRTHIIERLEAGQSVREALHHMGAPEEVARAYLGEIRLPFASLGRRVAAFLIDISLGAVLVAPGILLLLGGAPLLEAENLKSTWWLLPVGAAAVLGLSAMLLSVVYFPALEVYFGQTLGKRLLGLCVTMESGEQIGWGAAILRRLPFFLEFFWLDALFALFTQKRQRAFDMVAKTLVVRCS
jgi:uncharacterized RDD family membrane protein YckC